MKFQNTNNKKKNPKVSHKKEKKRKTNHIKTNA